MVAVATRRTLTLSARSVTPMPKFLAWTHPRSSCSISCSALTRLRRFRVGYIFFGTTPLQLPHTHTHTHTRILSLSLVSLSLVPPSCCCCCRCASKEQLILPNMPSSAKVAVASI
ncbi:hypothetical protein GQ54DRAFT_190213 [Martensiomyces pterosporus]|nr:hypothetical protein GQ54DRAFT_190213 [Martensiomyces pterosporus]